MKLLKIVKLKMLRSRYLKGDVLSLNDMIQGKFREEAMEYIWRCPRSRCGSIIIKTKEPFLKRGKTFKCKRCLDEFTSDELINSNKKNIKLYLDEVENGINTKKT